MLPRHYRLVKKQDIERIFKYGRWLHSPFFMLKFLPNQLKVPRLVVVVGLKVHKKATKRNRLKRQLQEILRAYLKEIKPGFDLILIAKTTALNKNYKILEKEVLDLLRKSYLLPTASSL